MALAMTLGCAKNVIVHSLVDTTYPATKNEKIYLMPHEDAPIETRRLHNILRASLESSGFTLVDDIKQSDKFVNFSVDNKRIKVETIMPETRQTIIRGRDASGRTLYIRSHSTHSTPHHYSRDFKKIAILFADSKKHLEDKISKTTWEGYLTVEQELYDNKAQACLEYLLTFYGKEQDVSSSSCAIK